MPLQRFCGSAVWLLPAACLLSPQTWSPYSRSQQLQARAQETCAHTPRCSWRGLEGVRSQQVHHQREAHGASRLPQTSRRRRSPSGSRTVRSKEKKGGQQIENASTPSSTVPTGPRPVYLCRRFVPYLNSPEGPFPGADQYLTVSQKRNAGRQKIMFKMVGSAALYSPPHSQPLPLCRWDLPGLNSFGGGSEWTVGERQLASTPSGLHLSPLAWKQSGSEDHSSQSRVGEPWMIPFLPHPLPRQADQASPLRVPPGCSICFELLLSFPVPLPAPALALLVRQDIPVKIFCAYFKSLINDSIRDLASWLEYRQHLGFFFSYLFQQKAGIGQGTLAPLSRFKQGSEFLWSHRCPHSLLCSASGSQKLLPRC